MTFGTFAIIFLCLTTSIKVNAEMKSFNLKTIHQSIISDYQDVDHISRKQLDIEMKDANKSDYIFFDVREADEFAVSHIEGAKLLLPSTWKSSFFKKHGPAIKGTKVIFYCSVGVRSSKMAKYLKKDLINKGALKVYNLEEGIFGWANDGKQLVKAEKSNSTNKVHPYNNHWGQLIDNENLRSYKP